MAGNFLALAKAGRVGGVPLSAVGSDGPGGIFRVARGHIHKEAHNHATGLGHFNPPDDQSQSANHGLSQTNDGFLEGGFVHNFLKKVGQREVPADPRPVVETKKRGPIQATPL